MRYYFPIRISQKTNICIGLVVFSITAVVCSFLTIRFYLSVSQFVKKAVEVEGIVIKNQRCDSSKSKTMIPVISFTTKEGKTIEFKPGGCSSAVIFKENEKVKVLYLENNPVEAEINRRDYLYVYPVMFGYATISFLFAVGVAIYLLRTGKDEIEGMSAILITCPMIFLAGFSFIFLGKESIKSGVVMIFGGLLLLGYGLIKFGGKNKI